MPSGSITKHTSKQWRASACELMQESQATVGLIIVWVEHLWYSIDGEGSVITIAAFSSSMLSIAYAEKEPFMTDKFGISHIGEYLLQMNLKVVHIDHRQETVKLVFHNNLEQWQMVVCFQQRGEVRKLVLIVPHIGAVTTKKRLECLEALMAVNYRIAMGKFGLDLDDGEVRLEEAIPLAAGRISFEQFRLACSAMMQTVGMYHTLLSRILYGNLSVLEALDACEKEFLQDMDISELADDNPGE